MHNWFKEYRSVAVLGSSRNCLALKFPQVTNIVRLSMKQVGGTPTNFTVALYSRKEACEEGSSMSLGGEGDSESYAADPEIYRVSGVLAGTSGELFVNFDPWLVYENRDGNNPITRQGLIYLEIIPIASGPMTFDIGIACQTDND